MSDEKRELNVHAGNRPPAWGVGFGKLLCRLLGWTPIGEYPQVEKAIFIASPHTTLWDGLIMLCVAWAMGVRLSWITKKETVRFPFKTLTTYFGAVPVDRSKSNDTVKQVATAFHESNGMFLAIAPDGTRKRRDHWKSGFYHMALEANVPVICGFLDYRRKEGGICGFVELTGDVRTDMDRFREIYADVVGKFPAQMTPIRLRAEDEADANSRGIA